MKKHVLAWIVSCSVCVTFAQVQEQLTPTEKRYQTPVTEPLTLYQGFLRVGFSTTYNTASGIFDENGKRKQMPGIASGNTWQFSPYAQYGIRDRLQVEIEIPFTSSDLASTIFEEFPRRDTSSIYSYNTPTRGLGDVNVGVAYQILAGNYLKPFLGVSLNVSVPTGRKNPYDVNPNNPQEYREGPGRGEFVFIPAIRFRKINFPYSVDLSLSYRYHGGGKKLMHASDTVEVKFWGGNTLSAQASWNTHVNNWIIFRAILDANFAESTKTDYSPGFTSYLIRLLPAMIFQVKGIRIATGITYPILGKMIPSDPGYTVFFSYTF